MCVYTGSCVYMSVSDSENKRNTNINFGTIDLSAFDVVFSGVSEVRVSVCHLYSVACVNLKYAATRLVYSSLCLCVSVLISSVHDHT